MTYEDQERADEAEARHSQSDVVLISGFAGTFDLAPTTRHKYERCMWEFRDYLETWGVESVRSAHRRDVTRFLRWLEGDGAASALLVPSLPEHGRRPPREPLSASSRKGYLSALRAFYRFCLNEEHDLKHHDPQRCRSCFSSVEGRAFPRTHWKRPGASTHLAVSSIGTESPMREDVFADRARPTFGGCLGRARPPLGRPVRLGAARRRRRSRRLHLIAPSRQRFRALLETLFLPRGLSTSSRRPRRRNAPTRSASSSASPQATRSRSPAGRGTANSAHLRSGLQLACSSSAASSPPLPEASASGS